MDLPHTPTGCQLSLTAMGEAWSWRLTTENGDCVRGLAPDRNAARRSAAFAASVVGSLERTRLRRF